MTQTGSFSTEGMIRMGSTSTGLGAVFNKLDDLEKLKPIRLGLIMRIDDQVFCFE
jgi:hypothetical protein